MCRRLQQRRQRRAHTKPGSPSWVMMQTLPPQARASPRSPRVRRQTSWLSVSCSTTSIATSPSCSPRPPSRCRCCSTHWQGVLSKMPIAPQTTLRVRRHRPAMASPLSCLPERVQRLLHSVTLHFCATATSAALRRHACALPQPCHPTALLSMQICSTSLRFTAPPALASWRSSRMASQCQA